MDGWKSREMGEGGALRKHSFCYFPKAQFFPPEDESMGGGFVGGRGSETTHVTLLNLKLQWDYVIHPFSKFLVLPPEMNLSPKKIEWTMTECNNKVLKYLKEMICYKVP